MAIRTILEKFDIKISGDILVDYKIFEQYNLIGLDYGDGELSAAKIEWNYQDKKLEIKTLAFDRGAILFKTPNAYLINDHTAENYEAIDIDKADISLCMDVNATGTDKGFRCYNFKHYPGSEEAKAKYVQDDGIEVSFTNEQIMAKGFACVVNTLFDYNSIINRNKPTIILVGCPSSSGWRNGMSAYARLLQSALKSVLPETQKPVSIAIQTESTAALARETDPNLENHVRNYEIVVILDCGSSTFDITITTPSGIPEGGEDSYQFGGRQIDENMLFDAIKELLEQYPNQEANIRMHGMKLELRIKKEKFYGDDGDNANDQVYKIAIRNEDGTLMKDKQGRTVWYRYSVNEDSMDGIVSNPNKEEDMMVSATHISDRVGDTVKKEVKRYNSWIDGCEGTYQCFYDKMQHLFTTTDKDGKKIPDRVIMTGGVSVMKEVQEVAEKVFGVKPTVAKRPNYSVSEGLAYVLGNEILKMKYFEQLMKDMEEKLLPDVKSLREEILLSGIEEDWTSFYKATESWANNPEPRSLKDWYDEWINKWFIYGYGCVARAAESWYQKNNCCNKIEKALRENFAQMFPDYQNQFAYQLTQPNFNSLKDVMVKIPSNYNFFFNDSATYRNISSENEPLDIGTRQSLFRCFKSREEKIRNGGTFQYTYSHGGILGLFQQTEKVTGEYKGLRNAYGSEITEDVVNGIRKEIIELHRAPLKEYVESITPYFNMTSKKKRNTQQIDKQKEEK